MTAFKEVKSQGPCCQLEQIQNREERRQQDDVLVTDEGVSGDHGGDVTSRSF